MFVKVSFMAGCNNNVEREDSGERRESNGLLILQTITDDLAYKAVSEFERAYGSAMPKRLLEKYPVSVLVFLFFYRNFRWFFPRLVSEKTEEIEIENRGN